MTISSIVIRTRPENMADVEQELVATQLAEVHFRDDAGQIVATIEGDGVDEQSKKLKAIQALPHVLTANLSYVVTEEEAETADSDPDSRKE